MSGKQDSAGSAESPYNDVPPSSDQSKAAKDARLPGKQDSAGFAESPSSDQSKAAKDARLPPNSLWTADWPSYVEYQTGRRGETPTGLYKFVMFWLWLYQAISYEYVTWLIMKGYRNDNLGLRDFPKAQPADSAEYNSDGILNNWNIEFLEAAKKGRKPSIWRVIFRTFGSRYSVCMMLAACEEVTKIANAILLGLILRWLRDPTAEMGAGYLYAGLMMISTLVDAVLRHFMFFISIRTGFQMRVGFIAAVYRKLLHLSLSHTSSTGVIVNLVSNDVQKFEDFAPFAYFLILGPVESLIVGIILILTIGVGPALAGLATLYSIIPLQAYFANRFSLYRKETVKIRDERIRSTSDILFGMNVVKLYAWEEPFEARLNEMRDQEVAYIKKANRFRAINGDFVARNQLEMDLVDFFWFLQTLLTTLPRASLVSSLGRPLGLSGRRSRPTRFSPLSTCSN
jgi:ATP-binding cassette subfamily C (CFTR/MRP) protein 4